MEILEYIIEFTGFDGKLRHTEPFKDILSARYAQIFVPFKSTIRAVRTVVVMPNTADEFLAMTKKEEL